MYLLLFVLIAGVWAAFLLPPALQNRRLSPLNSTQEFSKLTRQLQKARDAETISGPAAIASRAAATGVDRAHVLARRRRILLAIIVSVVLSLAAAIAIGSVQLLVLHLIIDAGLIWYVVMLLQIKARQVDSVPEVVDLRTRVTAGEAQPQFKVISSR